MLDLLWDLMCLSACLNLIFVGGSWIDTSLSGLWFWNFNNASSNVGTGTGARLIILKIHIKGFGVFSASVLHYSILF